MSLVRSPRMNIDFTPLVWLGLFVGFVLGAAIASGLWLVH